MRTYVPMDIYIPTYGRGCVQPTYMQLLDAGLRPVLVVDKRDPYDYEAAGFVYERGNYKNIAEKRWALARRHYRAKIPYCTIDDDLKILAVGDGHGHGPAHVASKRELKHLFSAMLPSLLQQFAQVGVHQRAFVNYQRKPFVANAGGFPYRFHVYNPSLWKRVPDVCPTHSGSDIWFWHQLVTQGREYAIVTLYATGDDTHPTVPSHFTSMQKAQDFNDICFMHTDIGAKGFTRSTKGGHGTSIAYAKLTKYYLDRSKS